MMTVSVLAAWVLRASALVVDPRGHASHAIPRDGATAIAEGCLASPLFHDDDGRRCAALLVVMAARESGYQLGAVGDGGRAHGPFQVWSSAPATWGAAVRAYLPIVLRSIKACDEPLELLAAGRCGVPRARAISRERMREARRVFGAMAAQEGANDDG